MYWPVHNFYFHPAACSMVSIVSLCLLGFFKLNGFLQKYPRPMHDKVLLHSRNSLFLKKLLDLYDVGIDFYV